MCPSVWETMVECIQDYVQIRWEDDAEGNWRKGGRKETKKKQKQALTLKTHIRLFVSDTRDTEVFQVLPDLTGHLYSNKTTFSHILVLISPLGNDA